MMGSWGSAFGLLFLKLHVTHTSVLHKANFRVAVKSGSGGYGLYRLALVVPEHGGLPGHRDVDVLLLLSDSGAYTT